MYCCKAALRGRRLVARTAPSTQVTRLLDLPLQPRPTAMRSIPARRRRRPASGARPICDIQALRSVASKLSSEIAEWPLLNAAVG